MKRFREYLVASKKNQFKLWQKIKKREVWIEYKNVCKIVKGEVSKAKLYRYDGYMRG